MIRSVEDLYVGTVVYPGCLRVSPQDVAAHLQSLFFQKQSDPLLRGGMKSAVGDPYPQGRASAELTNSTCPIPVLLQQSLQLFQEQSFLRGYELSVRSIDRLRSMGSTVIGQPLDCVATVRFRDRQPGGEVFVSLAFELRKSGGGAVLRFEAGLEISLVEAGSTKRRLQKATKTKRAHTGFLELWAA